MYPDVVEKLVIWGANTFVAEEDAKLYRQNRDLQGGYSYRPFASKVWNLNGFLITRIL